MEDRLGLGRGHIVKDLEALRAQSVDDLADLALAKITDAEFVALIENLHEPARGEIQDEAQNQE